LQRVLTTVTLLGLLVATAAAFAITEHLKLEKSPIYGSLVYAGTTRPERVTGSTLFSPVCNCPTRKATVQIKLRKTGRVTVIIVDARGHKVATIAPNVRLRAHSPQHFTWDGRTDAGRRVPDGVYNPWIELPHRTFRFINKIIVDTKPPRVVSAAGLKPVLLAGPGRSVAIHYVFSEKAHALVYLGRRRIIVGRQTQGDKIKWSGRLEHRQLPAGTYVLSIGARDLAGNETPAAERKQVTIVLRYVELTPGRLTVRSGQRFTVHVNTAARRYTWQLGHRHGGHRGKILRLHAPSTPGTYRLLVDVNGHITTAVVRVGAK
jgi:FlgD Ig-like domain